MSPEQSRGARFYVRFGFILGIATTVAANVAHAWGAVLPVAAAALVPIFLLVSVEVMIRPAWHRTGAGWWIVRYGCTSVVGLLAGVTSYIHMSDLLRTFPGETALTAAIWPLIPDTLMVMCGLAMVAMSGPVRTSGQVSTPLSGRPDSADNPADSADNPADSADKAPDNCPDGTPEPHVQDVWFEVEGLSRELCQRLASGYVNLGADRSPVTVRELAQVTGIGRTSCATWLRAVGGEVR